MVTDIIRQVLRDAFGCGFVVIVVPAVSNGGTSGAASSKRTAV
jgi:hypothetical protein